MIARPSSVVKNCSVSQASPSLLSLRSTTGNRRPLTVPVSWSKRENVSAPRQNSRGLMASASTPLSSESASTPYTSTPVIDDFAFDSRPVILYDGVCNLCNGAVNLMLDVDPEGSFRLAALQSDAGRRLLRTCGRSADDISSIVVVEAGAKHHTKSAAVLRIAEGLSNPFPILALFGFPVPGFVRDTVYDLVADNRYSLLGKRDVCRLSDDRFTSRFIAN